MPAFQLIFVSWVPISPDSDIVNSFSNSVIKRVSAKVKAVIKKEYYNRLLEVRCPKY